MSAATDSLVRQCGRLILGGFGGEDLPRDYAAALEQGRRGGAILFRRNLSSPDVALSLTKQIHAAMNGSGGAPALVAIDQEGGRVRRLKAPLLELPPMHTLGAHCGGSDDGEWDVEALEALGRAVAAELLACGFNLNFAPVLDVNSNPANPVIGDRAFASEPHDVAELSLAFARGLSAGGVSPCGKHFPGHGDTESDSHLTLPKLPHSLERLRNLELIPFRAAVEAKLPSLMTAHIVFEALEPALPATLSPKVVTGLLRNELGYQGAVFSDCLEMQAISDHWPAAEASVLAIAAGCDSVLICHRMDRQEAALEALAKEAELSPAFNARVVEAAGRLEALAQAFPPHPQTREELEALFQRHQGLQAKLDRLTQQPTGHDPTER
ncbi:MAG: beta-N-acetylhexosaminidase [Polyangiaceae bacterium]|nr:beta-N-acetylhexosaminidase [Polyangiaceae bacterium]